MNFTHLRRVSASSPVLVTGHNGFKGTWLVQMLDFLGIGNVGLSLETEQDSLYARCNLAGSRSEYSCDLNNYDQVLKIMASVKPSVVLHLAAQPIVSIASTDPYSTFKTNVMGTLNLLEAIRQVGDVMSVGVITTDKVYRNYDLKQKRFKESDELGAFEPYGASKAAVEMLVQGYREILFESSKTKLISLRSGNVIGGGDFAKDRLIPDIVRAKISSRAMQLRNPRSTRPWQHVLEPLVGYLLAVEYSLAHPKIEHTEFNFGPRIGDEMTVEELLNTATSIFPIDYELDEEHLSKKYHEAKYLQLDSDLASKVLGWQSRFSSEEAILSTLNWWNEYFKNRNARDLCNYEIQKYLNFGN